MKNEEIKRQWRDAAIILGAIALAVLGLFFGTVETLVLTWWDKPEYNHCLLILPIIGYLIYERREIFQKLAPEPSLWGVIPIVGGGALWLLGDLADANVVRQFGLVILLQGSFLTILGKRVILALLFPIFYMIFLIPFGDFLVPMLQDYTTQFVVLTLNLLDIPVYVEGVFLSIPAGDFHVAEACAGLRFLVATVALGTLMANVAYNTVGRQIIVVVLSFVVPVVANGFRASGIVLVAHWSDMKYATGVDHLVFGWIFFAIVLLIFISIAMTFTNRPLHEGYIDFSKEYWRGNHRKTLRNFLPFLMLSLLLVAAAPAYSSFITHRYQSFENNHLMADVHISGALAGDDVNWRPHYQGASQLYHVRKPQLDSHDVDVFIAYYKYQSRGRELIRFGNGVMGQENWQRMENNVVQTALSGTDHKINEVLLKTYHGQRLVWYWYWVDGQVVHSDYRAKLNDARAKLFGGRLDSAVVALSVPVNMDTLEAQRALLAKIAAELPALDVMVEK